MPLLTLPNEIVQRVAFWTAAFHNVLIPKEFVSFILTCPELRDIVRGTQQRPNYTVLADISRARFSTSAPRRRLGPTALTNRNLAMELQTRVPTLRRVLQCKLGRSHLAADLWVIYHMCLEDDGHNSYQLDSVQAERWVSQIIQRLPSDECGWRLETEIAHLAVAIYSLLAPRHPSTVDKEDHECVLSILRYYAFAAQRYQMSYLRVTTFTPQNATDVRATPTVVTSTLWGHNMYMCLPPVAISAALCFLDHWADVAADPYDNQLLPLSQRFDNDFRRLILSCISITSEAAPSGMSHLYQALSHVADGGVLTSPKAAIPSSSWFGVGRLWVPGMLTGEWAGEGSDYLIKRYSPSRYDPNSLPTTFKFGHGNNAQDGVLLSMKITLREHVWTNTKAYIGSSTQHDSSFGNAWFLELTKEADRVHEKNHQLCITDPAEPDPLIRDRCYHTVTHSDDQHAPQSYMKSPEAVIDVVLTGEIVIKREIYQLFGRVRTLDGLVQLVQLVPPPITSVKDEDTPHWIFHGYVVGGCTLVGRWRNLISNTAESSPFEGTFILKKKVGL